MPIFRGQAARYQRPDKALSMIQCKLEKIVTSSEFLHDADSDLRYSEVALLSCK